jgi:thymidine kinase
MYSGKCYHPKTLILNSKREYQEIRSLKVDDVVHGWDDKPKKVIETSRHVCPVYRLSYWGGEMIVSENHQMVLWDKQDSKIVNCTARELSLKDKKNFNVVMTVIIPGIQHPTPYNLGLLFSNKLLVVTTQLEEVSSETMSELFNTSRAIFPKEIKDTDIHTRIKFCQGVWEGSNRKTTLSFANKDVLDGMSWVFWSVGVPNKPYTKKGLYKLQVPSFCPHTEDYYLEIKTFVLSGTSETVGVEVEDSHVILENCAVGHNSSQIIHEMEKYYSVGNSVFCINSKKDTRSSGQVILTHSNMTIPCCKVDRLADAVVPSHTTVIGIDEAQFFDDLIPFVNASLKKGITLVVAGLDGDSQQRKFGSILDLIPQADTYTKKYALCQHCSKPASFTHRLEQSKSLILIGGKGKYIALCRECKYATDNKV